MRARREQFRVGDYVEVSPTITSRENRIAIVREVADSFFNFFSSDRRIRAKKIPVLSIRFLLSRSKRLGIDYPDCYNIRGPECKKLDMRLEKNRALVAQTLLENET